MVLQRLRNLFERKEYLLLFIAGIITLIVLYLPFVRFPKPDVPISDAQPVAGSVGTGPIDVTLDPYVFKPMILADVSPEIDLKRPEVNYEQGPVTKCARPHDVLGPGMTGQPLGSTSGYN